jgi:hypothetical protein
MPANVLSAIITADGGQFNKTLADLEKQYKAFQNGLKSATGVESFQRITRAAEETKRRIDALKGIGNPLRPIQGGANEASQSLINLGRVVQDAPFGFLGIANNLNPLIEGFSRTSKAAGGFGGAMKAVGSQLLGAGGLSLGISLVSSALILFGDKLFGGSKQANALQETLKNLSSQFSDEAVKLTTLVGVIRNANTSRADQKKALEALNEQYGKHLSNLGIEKVSVENVTKAYDALVESLLKQAVVKGLQEQISQQVEETAKKIISLQVQQENEAQKGTVANRKRLTDEQKQRKNLVDGLAQQNNVVRDGVIAQAQAAQAQAAAGGQALTFEARIGRLTGKLKEQLAPLLNLTNKFSDLGIELQNAKKGEDVFDKTIRQAKELAAFLDKNTQFQVGFEVDPRDKKGDTFAKAKEFIAKAQSFFDKNASDLGVFKFKPQVRIEFDEAVFKNISAFVRNEKLINNLRSQAEILGTRSYDEVKKSFEAEIKRSAENNPFIIKARANLLPLTRAEILRRGGTVSFDADFDNKTSEEKMKLFLEKVNNQFIDVARRFQESLGSAIGQGIGDALTGGGFAAIFKGIFNVVGSAMQSLGEALLATAIGLKAIKAAFKTLNPAVALAAGIGLIALGAVIKNTVGNIGGRAGGGPVQPGKPYTVGELGRELFIPSSAGRIIPNNALRSSGNGGFMGAPQFALTATNSIRGKDIVQVFTLEMISQGRTA